MTSKVPCPLSPDWLVDADDCSCCNDEMKCQNECHGCCMAVIDGTAPFTCAQCGDSCRDGLNAPREVEP